ncbi:glycosyltransferase family 2 protein [Clostridium sp. 'deep sea']|uniref:glycosyltransferase family 2 protein n=1 Tax=Clostridium sp. 'deep sea' TaxID=2779445 RepID=UPI0018966607|nr:glycosyltransferase [Clostridium sp. 'deep sea']QOR35430.1 glycosyltransferase family 2 protein [Clostridium sp. 'deep sea']
MKLKLIDYLFLYSFTAIWLLLIFNVILALGGYVFYSKLSKRRINILKNFTRYPYVSILIPAHNEEKVIARTVEAMSKQFYPKDRYEIIIINDNSQDNTLQVLEALKRRLVYCNIKIISTTKKNGGKGKSNALNIGKLHAQGEFIAVYDADNTPESFALRYLVYELLNNETYGAVIGKFRTRNKYKNILTRFINIETLSFQWMAQAGRFKIFNICTIPGTNFIIRSSALEKIGGWDSKAIAEDTEISFKLFEQGYRIGMMPLAVTWEQEPETLNVWFKQRTRWVKGNIYVVFKYLPKVLSKQVKNIGIDIFYLVAVYFLFLSSLVLSNIIFLVGIFTPVKLSLAGNFLLLWVLAYIIFVLQILITLAMEKGESSKSNILYVLIIYFTYCQLWMVVAGRGIVLYLTDMIFKRETTWYKTERFD